MKKVLFIAVALFSLVLITSCENDSIEDLQQQENELNQIETYAREGDTGHEEVGDPEEEEPMETGD